MVPVDLSQSLPNGQYNLMPRSSSRFLEQKLRQIVQLPHASTILIAHCGDFDYLSALRLWGLYDLLYCHFFRQRPCSDF